MFRACRRARACREAGTDECRGQEGHGWPHKPRVTGALSQALAAGPRVRHGGEVGVTHRARCLSLSLRLSMIRACARCA